MKKLLIVVVALAVLATFAFAATMSTGTVVAVDGNKVTIEVDKSDMKVGDKVKIENGGKDGKFGGSGMKMKGC